MVDSKNNRPIPCWIRPARVLACLTTNRITVLTHPDQGLADGGVPIEVETSLIPLDLRMPNSEFVLLLLKDTSEIVKVLRAGEEVRDARFLVDNA
jgi:hypothetical protein